MEAAERREIEREVHAKARSRVRAKLGLAWHVAAFVLVNAALYALNHAYSPHTLWFVWPLAGWGTALAFHAFAVLSVTGLSEDMLQAEIRRELARRGLN
jgi:hypothetical protein